MSKQYNVKDKNTRMLHIRLDEETYKKLVMASTKYNISMSRLMRNAFNYYFNAHLK